MHAQDKDPAIGAFESFIPLVQSSNPSSDSSAFTLVVSIQAVSLKERRKNTCNCCVCVCTRESSRLGIFLFIYANQYSIPSITSKGSGFFFFQIYKSL